MPEPVWMVAKGQIDIRRGGSPIRQISAGDFVGETSFLTTKPMGVDAEIMAPIRCLSWASSDLETFMKSNPEIGATLQRLLGRCLVRMFEKAHQ